ncbi:MAG: helix-turn-helix domain-containing protein, partial [Gemmatimonadales bacterium]
MARRLKDIDSADRVNRFRVLVYALIAGPIVGGLGGAFVARSLGLPPVVGGLIGMPLGFLVVYKLTMTVVERTAKTMEQIYNPSAKSTPRRAEYSYAASLVARGRYEEALAAYELHAIEHPEDPQPFFQAARICREHLRRPEDAIAWYRRARADSEMTQGEQLFAMQEIIELYMRDLKTPRRAIPELSMLIDRFPDTPNAQAARRELAQMRELLAQEHEGFEKFTEQFLKKIGRDTLSQAAGLTREALERQLIQEALEETNGDRRLAAEKIGITEQKLTEAMRELKI